MQKKQGKRSTLQHMAIGKVLSKKNPIFSRIKADNWQMGTHKAKTLSNKVNNCVEEAHRESFPAIYLVGLKHRTYKTEKVKGQESKQPS